MQHMYGQARSEYNEKKLILTYNHYAPVQGVRKPFR